MPSKIIQPANINGLVQDCNISNGDTAVLRKAIDMS